MLKATRPLLFVSFLLERTRLGGTSLSCGQMKFVIYGGECASAERVSQRRFHPLLRYFVGGETRTGESVGEPCPGQPGDSPASRAAIL